MLKRTPFSAKTAVGRSHWRRGSVVCATFALDLLIVLAAAILLPLFRLNEVGRNELVSLAGFLAIVYSLSAFYLGAYDSAIYGRRRAYIGRPVRALLLSYALLFMAFFLLKAGDEYSRLIVGLMALVTVPGVMIGRLVIFRWTGSQAGARSTAEIVLVDGVDAPVMSGIEVVDAASWGLSSDLSDLDSVSRMAELSGSVERVIVYCPQERRRAWAKALKCLAVRSEICIPELEGLHPLALGESGPYPSVVVSEHPLLWRQAATKRIFDIVVSATLLVLTSPLLFATAIAIRWESPGPALFRQPRLGFGNRTFVMLKFRSMRHDKADKTASKLTQRNDSRLTKVGSFIRRTSIDEMPQLLNVLLGEMSLVGPRPHAPAALAGEKLYWQVDEKYWQRHIAKPGITGLAQIRGFRGNTFEESDLQARLNADLEYVANWSLTRDVEILLATLRVLVHDKAF